MPPPLPTAPGASTPSTSGPDGSSLRAICTCSPVPPCSRRRPSLRWQAGRLGLQRLQETAGNPGAAEVLLDVRLGRPAPRAGFLPVAVDVTEQRGGVSHARLGPPLPRPGLPPGVGLVVGGGCQVVLDEVGIALRPELPRPAPARHDRRVAERGGLEG